MWDATRAAFYGLTLPLESDIPHMYRDIKGYLTWGMGIKDDPGPTMTTRARQWIKCNGYDATDAEIVAEWNKIKAGPIGADAASKIAGMYCPQAERDQAFWVEVINMEQIIKDQFPSWEDWPADAQLALLSMAWNFGPAFKVPPAPSGGGWPDLAAHLDSWNFDWAAGHCQPAAGPNQRSRQCKVLFYQASRSHLRALNAGVLYGPGPVITVSGLKDAVYRPVIFNSYGWWVQAMLIDAGLYTLTHDGLFGPASQSSWTSFLKSHKLANGYTAINLASLSAASLKVMTTE